MRRSSAAFALQPAKATAPQPDERSALKSWRIWDGHCHMFNFDGETPEEKMDSMLRLADRMGIERLCVYLGYPANFYPTPEQLRGQNDQVLRAVNHSHGRAFGYVFVSPMHLQASLDELNRCVRDGPMIGVKFEFDTPRLASSPELDPIVARAGELRAVIMHHTWIKTTGNQVGESTPADLSQLARRHPSVTIICAHTGGNWEIGLGSIRGVKNLFCDLSGSDPTAGLTEMVVREVGPERVMYGSDVGGRSFASQLGKVMGAHVSDSVRRLILGGNLRRLLQPIFEAKGMRL
ncbi:MAG: amidohydrolase family protein [Bryobacteraceae bacterium]